MSVERREISSGPVPVLLMVREMNIGGIERDVAKLAVTLDRSRFEPHVAFFVSGGMRYDELRAAGVPLLHVPVRSFKHPSLIQCARLLAGYMRRHRMQVVHAWDMPTMLIGLPVARWCGVPVVVSSQLGYRDLLGFKLSAGGQLASGERFELQASGGGLWRTLLRATDRMVDAVVVNCEAMRRHLIEDDRVPAGRIELCYNGVSTAEFFPAECPKPAPLAGVPLVVGTVCALRPEKGLEVLQEAFARVRRLCPGMKLVMVGSGAEQERLETNARRLGLGEAQVMVPTTPRVPEWLRAMDIFVLPSHSEAFSNALLEAMACGCGAVGSRVGGTPELIGDDERGLLFRRGDPADLAAKLERLIRDPALRRAFGARAAEFARRRLTIEIAAGRMAAIYDKLLARGR